MNYTIEYYTKSRKYFISEVDIVNGQAVYIIVKEAGYEYYKALRMLSKILRGEDA